MPLDIKDEAISVDDVYGGKGQRAETATSRLVLVSNKFRNISVLRHAVLLGTSLLQYNNDSQTLDGLLCKLDFLLLFLYKHFLSLL